MSLCSAIEELGVLVSARTWHSPEDMVIEAQNPASDAYKFLEAMSKLRQQERRRIQLDQALIAFAPVCGGTTLDAIYGRFACKGFFRSSHLLYQTMRHMAVPKAAPLKTPLRGIPLTRSDRKKLVGCGITSCRPRPLREREQMRQFRTSGRA